MALQFGASFQSDFDRFQGLTDLAEFRASIVPFIQYTQKIASDTNHPLRNEVLNWKVRLFNPDGHTLYPHQVQAIEACLSDIVFSNPEKKDSGYCFMPTSAGKGHILLTLAAMAVGNFVVHDIALDAEPTLLEKYPYLNAILISLSLEYARKLKASEVTRTQILVHDVEILEQLKGDAALLLSSVIASKIEFLTVQAHGHKSEDKLRNLKYVIIDECHWGNATPDETIQSELVQALKSSGGKAFGFTASPYENPDGKFQRTWSHNKINSALDFNYYLDNGIVYPVTLREVNLQNARPDFAPGTEEVDLTEKSQVIEFMANHIMTVLPETELDGPAVCYFNPIIIPDIVERLLGMGAKSQKLRGRIKVLASDSAEFAEKCRSQFGPDILATSEDITKLKQGEKIFLISAQKLLVGLNAPLLRYCFISPTNSKIKIMQAIGRLMRPTNKVPKKLATLFLTSLTGRKLDIGDGSGKAGTEETEKEPKNGEDDQDLPKTRYTTTSMTLSEAYDLPIKVFYKTEVGFRDFINQTRVDDGNTVERLKTSHIPKEDLDEFDALAFRNEVNRIRDICRTQYRDYVLKRDNHQCQGKKVIGARGCDRTSAQVNLEIHHMPPFEFHLLFRDLGAQGCIEWHRDPGNFRHLVTLCETCHDLFHKLASQEDEAAGA